MERLLQYAPKELESQPLGPLLLLIRAPEENTGSFTTQLLAHTTRDMLPPSNSAMTWLHTSEVPTVRAPSQEAPDADQVELLAELGSGTHCIIPLLSTSDRAITLGRSPKCRIVLSDPSVSADHAEIRLEDGGVRITDAKSKNGTIVNGVRLPEGANPWLQPMDRISFGRVPAFVCEPRTLRAVLRQDLRTLL